MVLFDTTALTVALPDLARDLGAGVEGLAWVTDAYTLTFAGFLLAGGVIADRCGPGPTFLAGLAGFAAASIACAAAPSAGALIAARALLGIAGALLLPASLALIAALYDDRAARAKAIAAWAAISAAALTLGPLLGGVIVATAGWRGIFLANVPVAIAAGLLLRGRLPAGRRRAVGFAAGRHLLAFIAIAALTATLIWGGSGGWTGAPTLAAAVVALAAGLLAIDRERRSATPVVPRSLSKQRMFAGSLVGGLAVGAVLAGELFLMTLQLQEGRGLGAGETGLAFLPLTLPMMLNPPLAARLVARVGSSGPVLLGLSLITVAATALAALRDDCSLVMVGLALALLGLGVSFTLPALTTAAVLAAPPEATGAASGLFSVARQVGATLGVAAAAAIGVSGGAGRGHALMAFTAAAAAVVWSALSWGFVAPRERLRRRSG